MSTVRWLALGVLSPLWFGCGADASDTEYESDSTTSAACLRALPTRKVEVSPGIEISYVEQGHRSSDSVILIHGYTDSHHSFDRNLRELSRHFRVFAIDQRGHGDSSKPACCYTQQDLASDIIAFMDALDLPTAHLVGHSMGSFVAQTVALSHPERVNKLVLIGSAPTVAGNAVAEDLAAVVATLEDPIDPEFVREFQASTFYRAIPDSFLDTAVSESLKVPAAIWKQALSGLIGENHASRLDEITAETLVLYGSQDVFFPIEDQQALDLGIPTSSLIVYPDTGHGTHVELPRRVVRDMTHFLD